MVHTLRPVRLVQVRYLPGVGYDWAGTTGIRLIIYWNCSTPPLAVWLPLLWDLANLAIMCHVM